MVRYIGVRKIIFFAHTEWSTGRLYFELCKRLYHFEIDSHILDWERQYNVEEILEQNKVTDLWVSSSPGIVALHYRYNIPLEKCVLLLFHPVDIAILQQNNIDVSRLANFAAVANWIQKQCNHLPIQPKLVTIGINTHTFKCELPKQLKTLGFGSAYHSREYIENFKKTNPFEPAIFKRGYLVKEIAEKVGLEFKAAFLYHKTYRTMPGFYNEVDCILCPSEDEGAGGPVIEGGAAGRLIITTNTGGYEQFITKKGADSVSVSENLFITETIENLKKYIESPKLFQSRCEEIQTYALRMYDWDNFIEDWVKLFNK